MLNTIDYTKTSVAHSVDTIEAIQQKEQTKEKIKYAHSIHIRLNTNHKIDGRASITAIVCILCLANVPTFPFDESLVNDNYFVLSMGEIVHSHLRWIDVTCYGRTEHNIVFLKKCQYCGDVCVERCSILNREIYYLFDIYQCQSGCSHSHPNQIHWVKNEKWFSGLFDAHFTSLFFHFLSMSLFHSLVSRHSVFVASSAQLCWLILHLNETSAEWNTKKFIIGKHWINTNTISKQSKFSMATLEVRKILTNGLYLFKQIIHCDCTTHSHTHTQIQDIQFRLVNYMRTNMINSVHVFV